MNSVFTFKMLSLIAVAAIFILNVSVSNAGEKNNGKSKGHQQSSVSIEKVITAKGKGQKSGNWNQVRINSNDRITIRNYLQQQSCPPGLAKKNNGCLPPGQAKKYSVGQVFVGTPRSIWHALADLLSPPPAGTRYIRADNNDVLLINRSDNTILDVIGLQ